MNPSFAAEIAKRIGQRCEVVLDDRLIEGVLAGMSSDTLVMVESSTYGPSQTTNVAIDKINFIRYESVPYEV